MDKKQKLQMLGSFALLLVAAGVLFWAFTRTEEERLDLSKATLRGRVTYKGQPVSNAMIIVATESGNTVAGTGFSDNSGNYFVQYAPTGNVRIGVNTDAGQGMARGAIMAAAVSGDKSEMPRISNVPKKFFNPETSGITAVLSNTEGENEFNISLN